MPVCYDALVSKRQSKPTSPSSSKRDRSPSPAPLEANAPPEAPADESAPAPPAPEEFDITAVYTLEELVEDHGFASVEEVDAYLEGATHEELVAKGAEVATERISRDASRIYGIAGVIRERATPAQEELLPAVTLSIHHNLFPLRGSHPV